MKTEDRYLKFVRWSDEDKAYVGFCPDLFPWGGVCHGADEEQTYRELRELVPLTLLHREVRIHRRNGEVHFREKFPRSYHEVIANWQVFRITEDIHFLVQHRCVVG
jgi:hypothetical protein